MKKLFTFILIALSITSCSSKQADSEKENQNEVEIVQSDPRETLENHTDELSQIIIPTVDSIRKEIQEIKESCKSCDCDNAMDGSMAEIAHCSTLESMAFKLKLYQVYEQNIQNINPTVRMKRKMDYNRASKIKNCI